MPRGLRFRKFDIKYSAELQLECMMVTKCDLCKKEIKNEPIIAGLGFFRKAELCGKCGAPIVKFLKRNKFLTKENKIKR